MTTLVGHKVRENLNEVLNDSGFNPSTTVDGRADLFGHVGQAAMYREFRPQYSKQMIETVVSRLPHSDRGLYIDIACGPGTLTELVAPYFSKTLGIDQSFEQLKCAAIVDGCDMEYVPGSAFAIPVESGKVDFLTVAQGLHWLLPYEDFFSEVLRVLKPGGLFTAFAYAFPRLVNPEAQKAIEGFYFGVLGSHLSPGQPGCRWETNRPTIDCFYADIPFPKEVITTKYPERKWVTVQHYMNYLKTLSAYRSLLRRSEGKDDPIPKLQSDIMEALSLEATDSLIEIEIPFFTVSFVNSV
ncbi:hypothetical protein C9890_0425 [Perkinsus sp. BL_2016]|nr:hypothetical protein C9890_0425 [Perkinsus sp. BL_2016]